MKSALKSWRDLRQLPMELWLLCLATLINRMGTMALPFLVLYLTRSRGFSAAEAGAMLAVYGGVSLVVSPIAGRLSDRFGPLVMMEGCLLSSGAVLLLYPLATSWLAILIATVLFSMTIESFRPANLALIGELAGPEHRKQAFALIRLAVNLGMSVGPVVGGLLAQISFPALFAVDGITTWMAAAVLFFSPFHERVGAHVARTRQTPEGTGSERPSRPAHPLAAFFSDRRLRYFLLGGLPVSIIFFQGQAAMPLFLVQQVHFSTADYGLLWAVNTLLIVFLEIPLNSATAHWSHSRSMTLGSILFGIGFGALALVRSYGTVALTVVIWTFGEMILFPAMSAYVSELAPDHRRGEYMGLYTMSFSLAYTIGPWLGTVVLERAGASTLWLATFLLGALSAWALRAPRPARGRASST